MYFTHLYDYVNHRLLISAYYKIYFSSAFSLMLYLNSLIYPIGTPAGSGLSTLVFYDPNNEVIR